MANPNIKFADTLTVPHRYRVPQSRIFRSYSSLNPNIFNTDERLYITEYDIDTSWLLSDFMRRHFEKTPESDMTEIINGTAKLVVSVSEVCEVDSKGIDLLLSEYNIQQSNILILSNAVPTEVEYAGYVRYYPLLMIWYNILADRNECVDEVNLNKRPKKYTCLNRRHKFHRKYILSELYNHNLIDDGFVSYNPKLAEDVNNYDISLNPLLEAITNSGVDAIIPLHCDALDDPGHQNDHGLISKYRHYHTDAYWNFITETLFQPTVRFLTEKTFKPIANLQPFVIIGCHHSIATLQSLGFKTFGDYIDESYDLIEDNVLRIKSVTKLVIHLASMSHDDHIKLMMKIKPILEYNQKHFFELKGLENCPIFDLNTDNITHSKFR